MTEILKYLSPVAVLALLWGIIQFYQKRRNEIKDKQNEETIASYKALHASLSSFKNQYISLFAMVSQATLKLKKRLTLLTEVEIVELSDTIKRIGADTKKSQEFIQLIENNGFDKDERLITKEIGNISKRIELSKIVMIEIENRKSELEKNIALIREPLKKGDAPIFLELKDISKNLQRLILETNGITILAKDVKQKPHKLIQYLLISIQETVNLIEAEEEINLDNIMDVIKMNEIEETMKLMSKLEEHIFEVLN